LDIGQRHYEEKKVKKIQTATPSSAYIILSKLLKNQVEKYPAFL